MARWGNLLVGCWTVNEDQTIGVSFKVDRALGVQWRLFCCRCGFNLQHSMGEFNPGTHLIRMDFHRIGYSFLFAHVINCYVIQPWNDLLFNMMAGNHYFIINFNQNVLRVVNGLVWLTRLPFSASIRWRVLWAHISHACSVWLTRWTLTFGSRVGNLMNFHSPARKFGLFAGFFLSIGICVASIDDFPLRTNVLALHWWGFLFKIQNDRVSHNFS